MPLGIPFDALQKPPVEKQSDRGIPGHLVVRSNKANNKLLLAHSELHHLPDIKTVTLKVTMVAILVIALLTWVRDQKCFTISEVAADWHELMISQCIMRPSIARVSEQFDLRFAASRHTTAPISHIRPSPRTRKLLLISRPAEGRRLSWPEHTVG